MKERAKARGQGRRRVVMSGLTLFCDEVAAAAAAFAPQWKTRMLRTGTRYETFMAVCALASSDVWYIIGTPLADRWLRLTARLLRKPRVIHWVGTDIAAVAGNPASKPALESRNTLHLAEVEWTATQLRELGFEPRIAPLPPRHRNNRIPPLPQTFTITLYVPRTRSEFYGVREFERLMRALRDEPVRYIVVGGGSVEAPQGVDVENLGWRDDLEDVYVRTSALIRFTLHDGLSLMVLEALSFGRQVLWTQDFPYIRQIRTYDDMEREVRDLLEAHKRGTLEPQIGAADAVKRRFAPETCALEIARAWSDAVSTRVRAGTELAAEPS